MLPWTILRACRGQLTCHTRGLSRQAGLSHVKSGCCSEKNLGHEHSHHNIAEKPHRDIHACRPQHKRVDNAVSVCPAGDLMSALTSVCHQDSHHNKYFHEVKSQQGCPSSVRCSHVSTVRKLSAWQYLILPMLPHNSLVQTGSCWDARGQVRPFSMQPQAIVESSPGWLKPYLQLIRLDKPIGTWLLFLPCTWSISLAAAPGHLPDLELLALFGMGAFLMRGAGCIINDMWDKDFDAMVTRTKERPLPSGQLTYFQSLCCLGLHLSGALGILLCLNYYSIILGFACMGLVVTYPLMKRITYWPQLFLGFTFNAGAMIGWSAVHGAIDWSIVAPLYTTGILWTLVYDTIYAHQDKEDDLHIGVKSLPLRLGNEGTKPVLTAFAVGAVGLLGVTGFMCEQTWPYYCAVGGAAAHLAWQIYTVDLNNGPDCASKFRSNKHLGLLMLSGIILGTLLKPKEEVEAVNEAVNEAQDVNC